MCTTTFDRQREAAKQRKNNNNKKKSIKMKHNCEWARYYIISFMWRNQNNGHEIKWRQEKWEGKENVFIIIFLFIFCLIHGKMDEWCFSQSSLWIYDVVFDQVFCVLAASSFIDSVFRLFPFSDCRLIRMHYVWRTEKSSPNLFWLISGQGLKTKNLYLVFIPKPLKLNCKYGLFP